MNHLDQQYLRIIDDILQMPDVAMSGDRTGVGTSRVFNRHIDVAIDQFFPILHCKRVNWKSAFTEMLWMLSGSTNIQPLLLDGVHIWSDWPYKKYIDRDLTGEHNISMEKFEQLILESNSFAKQWGDLGPVYGKQWRDWDGIDQIEVAVKQLLETPNSRRIIIEGWNVPQLDDMALPPCHKTYQFLVNHGELNLTIYQRSADMFLGVPFNLCNGGLMLHLMAATVGLRVGRLHWFGADCHLYNNHKKLAEKMLLRDALPNDAKFYMSTLTDIDNVEISDIHIEEYTPHAAISAPVAV